MHQAKLFDSFFMGGFECSTHRRRDGQRLDLIHSSGHDRWAGADYAQLATAGINTVRDGLRWYLIERQSGRYDWSSFLPMLRAANEQRTQVIWDLSHYGCPEGLDIWRPEFVDRFARFAGAVATLVREESDQIPFYSLVNEMSFWSWAGGDVGYFEPNAHGRGLELKHQLVRASIAAIESVRAVEPRARFVQTDPIIHVLPDSPSHQDTAAAEGYRMSQFEAWDLLTGERWPGLGGKPEYLDIVGVNYYPHNQWILSGSRIFRGDSRYRPLAGMLAETWRRYQRPMVITETGSEGHDRASWMRYICEQVTLAMARGVPIEGICWYPILDYPGWDDDRHCPAGLLGYADGEGRRPLDESLSLELQAQQRQFALLDSKPAMEALLFDNQSQ
ncbi:beta-glucosidase [Pseudomonas sp. CCI1.2]|uniref:beta-glucosidase n=1 Tax=Pseudomonas sp. CCI1.2 TaxID=3048614 RepID=UPI002B2307A2|nr:beta-glucosidase [Pseudomonas sp. CCI1.2]MEB0119518.1 beta-glucosidase [Pseudomonas sp. CCI1.2]